MTADWTMTARHIEADEEDGEGYALLCLSEFDSPLGRYVAISAKPGSSNVYVEREEQSWSCYGGVSNVVANRRLLAITLNEHGRAELGDVEVLRIGLEQLSDTQYEEVKSVLRLLVPSANLLIED